MGDIRRKSEWEKSRIGVFTPLDLSLMAHVLSNGCASLSKGNSYITCPFLTALMGFQLPLPPFLALLPEDVAS